MTWILKCDFCKTIKPILNKRVGEKITMKTKKKAIITGIEISRTNLEWYKKGKQEAYQDVLWKIPRVKTFNELIVWLKAKIKEVEKK